MVAIVAADKSAPGPRGKRDREKEDVHHEGDLQRTLTGANSSKKQRTELNRLRRDTIAEGNQGAGGRRGRVEGALRGEGDSERGREKERYRVDGDNGGGRDQTTVRRGGEREQRGSGGSDRKRESAADDDGGDRQRASSSAASRKIDKPTAAEARRGRADGHKQGEGRRSDNHTDTPPPHHTSSSTEHRAHGTRPRKRPRTEAREDPSLRTDADGNTPSRRFSGTHT
jgi:hypothetical protein